MNSHQGTEVTSFRNLLRDRFFQMKAKNPRLSKRAFAQRLGISHGSLIEMLNGHRSITANMVKRLSPRLLISREKTQFYLENLKNSPVKSESLKTKKEFQLKEDEFQMISEWQHFAILNLIDLPTKIYSSSHLAERLHLPEITIIDALDRLIRLNLIRKHSRGHWIRTKRRLRTSDDILSLAIQKSHLGVLDLAQAKILSCKPSERDFTSLTMRVNSAKLPKAKILIRKFQDKLIKLLEDDESDEVMIFSTQLFPVTHTPHRQKDSL